MSFAKFPVPTAVRAKDASLVSGIRGVGSPFAPAVFGQNLGDYIATANRNTFITVQIESVDGLNNCEEIARVPGIGELGFASSSSLSDEPLFQTCSSSVPTTFAQVCGVAHSSHRKAES